jgi:hypothetical protein
MQDAVPANSESAGAASVELSGRDPGIFGGPQSPSEALDASAPDSSGDANASASDSSGAPSTESSDAGGGNDDAAADSGDAGRD